MCYILCFNAITTATLWESSDPVVLGWGLIILSFNKFYSDTDIAGEETTRRPLLQSLGKHANRESDGVLSHHICRIFIFKGSYLTLEFKCKCRPKYWGPPILWELAALSLISRSNSCILIYELREDLRSRNLENSWSCAFIYDTRAGGPNGLV